MIHEEKDILTANEFASLVGIHYNTVRQMIKKGKLNAFKIGHGGLTSHWRIPKSEIQRLSLVNLTDICDQIIESRLKDVDYKWKYNFYEKIEKTNTCWIWKGAKSKSGYGVYTYKKKYMRAHRASYIIHKGEIPKNILVLHSCHVRDCVNPEHLHLGTNKDNTKEMMDADRHNPPVGERHANYKLSNEDINDICLMRKNKHPAKEIAKKYNISPDYVYQVTNYLEFSKKRNLEID